ncbi:MAG: Trk system potassium transporter TrkA, partial [Enterococcus sp.]|nr:Trk system potassium transporter TrkA [Enterococcus sp.]
DQNPEKILKIEQSIEAMTACENGLEIEALREHRLDKFDFLVACTDADEKNILIASYAKALGCKKVIARVRNPENTKQIPFIASTMNIDHIVNPDLSITIEIYRYLAEKYTLQNGIFNTGSSSLLEFKAKRMPGIIDKKLSEVNEIMPGMLVVAVSKNGKIIIPNGTTVIESEDFVYMMGEKEAIHSLARKVHEKGKFTNIKKIMIIGGGNIGYYLARQLSEFGASVKLIESNKERCDWLADHLDNVLVLHGNGTDKALLFEENFDEMDAIVATTSFDEGNLLLSLMAKKEGVKDVISKISHKNYQPLIESLGIDMTLNPVDIITGDLLRYIQGEKRTISSILIQGQAEILEIIATSKMEIASLPLCELELPKGSIIASIQRGERIIVPSGNTKILEGDRVTIFCLLSVLPEIEKMMTTNKFSLFK